MVWGRRRRTRRWLDGWEEVAATGLPQWDLLDDDERARLASRVEHLVRRKHWEAARGFELTQEVVITIAASAGLLALGLDRDCYRHVRAVVVHPKTFTSHGVRATHVGGVVTRGPQRLLGHARDGRGPVMLSWRAVRRDVRHPERRQNVVVHEFAHKLDSADGLFDGTPEISDRADRADWVQVCNREYRRLRRRDEPDPVLRRYATKSPAEFFAVASEVFLMQPLALEEHHPELYRVLCGYYDQDPAGRVRRS
ncbi:M90 family metallopeptidase [Acidimicrobiia bacterium EGI L10123]|uniref:M90 family metallopeptidase n=1 Tax=Salinilacustrithrix flava TaxID=2957203 RepID=UPI003D7C16F6|nr:M90 family metallopeptidase [Acidimicrobiia bacterium EGI L10123]